MVSLSKSVDKDTSSLRKELNHLHSNYWISNSSIFSLFFTGILINFHIEVTSFSWVHLIAITID